MALSLLEELELRRKIAVRYGNWKEVIEIVKEIEKIENELKIDE